MTDVELTIKLLETSADVVTTVFWPGLLLYILARNGRDIRQFIAGISEVTFRGWGLEASAKRGLAVAYEIGRAVEKKSDSTTPLFNAAVPSNLIHEWTAPEIYRRVKNSKILWVDNNPEGNVFERRAMEAIGLEFDVARDTNEALLKTKEHQYAAIISDMARGESKSAGYDLLKKLRERDKWTPFIIYASEKTKSQVRLALEKGAQGTTNNPQELIQMVLEAVMSQRILSRNHVP